MNRKLLFTPTASRQLDELERDASKSGVLRQVLKALGYLEVNPKHPGLNTHEFTSLPGVSGEKVFEAYAQNNTSGAHRIFWHYGPDDVDEKKKRVATITIVAITPHP